MGQSKASAEELTRNGLAEILGALRGIHFGSVEITIHDASVVQIERREKLRLDRAAAKSPRSAT